MSTTSRLPRRPFSLKMQLTVVFGALVVFASIAITWGLSEMLRERVRADAGRSLAFIASNAAQLFGAGLQKNADVVDTLVRRDALWWDGAFHDAVIMSILQPEFLAGPDAPAVVTA